MQLNKYLVACTRQSDRAAGEEIRRTGATSSHAASVQRVNSLHDMSGHADLAAHLGYLSGVVKYDSHYATKYMTILTAARNDQTMLNQINVGIVLTVDDQTRLTLVTRAKT